MVQFPPGCVPMKQNKNIVIKNIYYLLSYAFDALRQEEFKNLASEEFEDARNLFAAILARGIGRQLKQGLYREYLNCREDLSTVRGRIELPGTLRNRLARKRLLTCEYDELSENNLYNQILKTTVMLLLGCEEVDGEYKSELKQQMMLFSRVDTLDPGKIRWAAIRFRRGNQTYRMLLGLCRFLLEGMLLTTQQGEYRLASFVDEQEMSRLYEKFILAFYRRECPQVKAAASQISWALDGGEDAMLPAMRSDITLSRGNQVLIIDAKCYSHTTQVQYDVHTIHSRNLYQIFTYVKNMDAQYGTVPHEVAGLLLYARTGDEIQPDVVYRMSGNRIGVKTLDLNREFKEIAAQLNEVVNEFFTL